MLDLQPLAADRQGAESVHAGSGEAGAGGAEAEQRGQSLHPARAGQAGPHLASPTRRLDRRRPGIPRRARTRTRQSHYGRERGVDEVPISGILSCCRE